MKCLFKSLACVQYVYYDLGGVLIWEKLNKKYVVKSFFSDIINIVDSYKIKHKFPVALNVHIIASVHVQMDSFGDIHILTWYSHMAAEEDFAILTNWRNSQICNCVNINNKLNVLVDIHWLVELWIVLLTKRGNKIYLICKSYKISALFIYILFKFLLFIKYNLLSFKYNKYCEFLHEK